MTVWFDNNQGRWIADNYQDAYEKACEVVEPVWWGDRTSNNHIVNLQRIRRPQAPDLKIKGGKLFVTEKPDV